ncbi:unnamed protein product [Clonostachys rosea f. rosea IK726]|uniref:Uncharacterized protein n=1 Tax=Clonostachys rosea f. rosea IK726 TaxID=1349383 RepID=A0ACA9UH95_BIOOC|nr:unnamed protein product [Clonostachys rosea f. rosea IK726]
MVGHFGTGLSRGPEQVDVEVVTASENRPALSNPDKVTVSGSFILSTRKNMVAMDIRGEDPIAE